jgi:hypothetical protein
MKTLVKRTLNNFGYDLVKRIQLNKNKGDFWKDWFNHFPVDLTNSYISNRNSLKKVLQWLDEKTYHQSQWGYGVPRQFFSSTYKYSLNHNPDEFTYSDLMTAVARKLGAINFLEIGVSAGKNFYQMFTALENSTLYGLDIEAINPALAGRLSQPELVWKSEQRYDFTNRDGKKVHKTYTSQKFHFVPASNTIYYLSGDKFNSVVWDQIKGIKFNIIFSDAFHRPDSIKNEYNFLKGNDLINTNNFMMVWDDLDSVEMQNAFFEICDELTRDVFKSKKTMFKLYDLHGTYAGLHKIGLFCSFQHRELRESLNL